MTSSSQFCPRCYMQMNVVGERRGGKAVVGAIVAGPIGIAAGALGKKKLHINVQNVGM